MPTKELPRLGRWPTDEEMYDIISEFGPLETSQIAYIVGVSKQAIHVIEKRALAKLRLFVGTGSIF